MIHQDSINRWAAERIATLRKKSVTGWARGDDVTEGGGAALVSPYQQSVWVYTAIKAIADQVTEIPFRISVGQRKGERIIEKGPLVDLLENPHPRMNQALFFSAIISWFCLRGESMIVGLDRHGAPVQLGKGRLPAQLAALSPDFFTHIVQGYDLSGWRFSGGPMQSPVASQTLTADEVLHDRFFNPYFFWRGMAPLSVALLAAATDFASAQFMKGLMLNNATMGTVVTTDQTLQDEQREQMHAALRERKRKAGTADRDIILESGLTIQPPTISTVDLEFIANRKMNRQEIFAVFKTPEAIAGYTEDANRSVSESQRLNFIQNTIAPICTRLEKYLRPIVKAFDPDFFGWFDIDSLPIMQEARRARVDSAVKVWGMGVPINEVNKVYDMGLPHLPWGDKGFLPFSVQEAGELGQADNAVPAADTTQDQKPKAALEFSRALDILRALNAPKAEVKTEKPKHVCKGSQDYEDSIAASVKLKAGKLSKYFFEQRGRVLANLEKLKKACGTDEERALLSMAERLGKATVSRGIDDIFDAAKETEILMGRMKPVLVADLEFGGAQLWKEFDLGDFKLKPEATLKFLANREQIIQDINATTFDGLKSTLSDGLSSGETFEQLAQRVKDVYKEASESRANTIAVTETNTAVNNGRWEGLSESGLELKGWLSSSLPNTRDSHLAAEAESKDGIPIDDLFSNGLRFPGDPECKDASEVINCRCHLIARAKTKEFRTVPLLRYQDWLIIKQRTAHA